MQLAALALLLALSTAPAWAGSDELPASIGVAHMLADGTIVLRLRSLPPGPIAEGELTYRPADRDYEEVRQHIGGIEPGEWKPVPPWPDRPQK